MTAPPTDAARRRRRKDDLLLASAVLREQAGDALARLSDRADAALNLGLQARAFVARPAVRWVGLGAGLSLILGWALRRKRPALLPPAAALRPGSPQAAAVRRGWRAGAGRAWRLGWVAWRAFRWVQQWQARSAPDLRR